MATDPSPLTERVAYLGVADLADLLDRRELSSVELVELARRRIAEVDVAGPGLRAVLAECPDAAERAAELDDERRRGRLRSPLHGIPVLVKDNLDTAGAPGTTSGSLALASNPPSADATAVAALRAAGAIVLAKANLSELANFRGKLSSSGWSAVGGQCRNPHALDRSPGGSSSGSGSGVAAGLAPVAVGTETDGSILCPAGLNGIVGIKPTVGLVSRDGIVPVALSQDTAGPMGRTVRDAASLLGPLAGGVALSDGAFRARPAGLPADYAAYCDPDGAVGARIGVPSGRHFGYHPRLDALFSAVLDEVRKAGATVVEEIELPSVEGPGLVRDEEVVLLHEFKDDLEAYLRARPADDGWQPRTLDELAAFNESHAAEELAVFGQELVVEAAATAGRSDPAYRAARERNWRRTRRDGIDAALAAGGVEVLAVPTMAPAWLIDHVNGDSNRGAGYQVPAVAGYPSLSLPIGRIGGLPVGLTLMAAAYGEPALIRVASGIEHVLALGAELRPGFRPTAG